MPHERAIPQQSGGRPARVAVAAGSGHRWTETASLDESPSLRKV